MDKDIYELLEKETELRQATEARAIKAEQGMSIALHRIKDLEAQLEAVIRIFSFFSLAKLVLNPGVTPFSVKGAAEECGYL